MSMHDNYASPTSTKELLKQIRNLIPEDEFANPEYQAKLKAFQKKLRQCRLDEVQRERRAWLENESGLPLRMVNLFLQGKINRMSQGCRGTLQLLEQGKSICVLLGPSYSGKTMAAAHALMHRKLKLDELRMALDFGSSNPRPGLFTSAQDLLYDIRFQTPLLAAKKQTPLLVIDNFHRHLAKHAPFLMDFMAARFDDDRETILTANFSLPGFQELSSERLLARLRAHGAILVLHEKYETSKQ